MNNLAIMLTGDRVAPDKARILTSFPRLSIVRAITGDCDMIDEIKALHDKVQGLRDEIKATIAKMNGIVGSYGKPIPQNWVDAIYWYIPEVKVDSFLDISQVKKVITPLLIATCKKCGHEFYAKSRSNRDEIKSSLRRKSITCPGCQPKIEISAHNDYIENLKKERERLAELKAMSYKEYLKTDEWQETRKGALKRSGYCCQLCNAKDARVHVHHRTYERKGEEWSRDLIVLCGDCHQAFHDKLRVTDKRTPFLDSRAARLGGSSPAKPHDGKHAGC